MRFYKPVALYSAFLLITGAGLTGCPRSSVEKKAAKKPIRIQMSGEPSTLDPWRAIDVYAFSVLRNVNEGLFVLDREGHLANGLAESYTVSVDRRVYRFKLRHARWSDGQLVDATDFVRGLRHLIDPNTLAPNVEYFFSIKNAKEIYEGKAKPETLGVFSEEGDLVMELTEPDPLLPLALTLPAGAPLRTEGPWTPTSPSTGDYRIANYKPADEIVLVPNPYGRTPGLRAVTFKILSEEMTAMNLLESGRIEVATSITTSEIDDLSRRGLIQTAPSTTVFSLSFNASKKPFNDLLWRRAVASVLDREGLKRALNGTYQPITSLIASSTAGHLPYRPLADSLAVREIRELKVKPRLKLAYGSSAFGKTVTEKIQADLANKLGLIVELEPMELKTLLGRLRADPPDMYLLGMSAPFDDPYPQLNAYSSAVQPNFSRYVSKRFEKDLRDMRRAPLGPARTVLAEEANRTLVEREVAAVPLLLRQQVFGVSKDLRGFSVSPFSIIQLKRLDK